MAFITQLPHCKEDDAEGIHQMNLGQNAQLPPAWRPDPNKVKILSFPTPFGRAEATSLALMDPDGGAAEYFQPFESLVLGAALGYFDADTYDLKTNSGNLGAALVNVAPDDQGLRYLTILRDRNSPDGRPYGVTHPECLFYAHARRGTQELQALHHRVMRDPDLDSARGLLADFKQMLDNQGRWDAAIPWMRGIDRVIGGAKPSAGLETLQCDASSVAAIPLVTRNPIDFSKRDDLCLLWFPRLNRGIRRKFQGWVRGEFVPGRGHVAIVDSRQAEAASIKMPASTDPDQNILCLGAGIVTVADQSLVAQFPNARQPNIQGADGKPGLKNVLQPVTGAIDAERVLWQAGSRPLTPDSVRRFPAFYPDMVRWTVATMGNVLVENATVVQYSSRLNALLNDGLLKSFPDASALGEGTAENCGYVCSAPDGTEFCLVERIEGKDVGDLRTVGLALFMHFTRKAQVEFDRLRNSDGDDLIQASDDHPFEPNYRILRPLQDEANRSETALRLATLQRFWKTYKQFESSANPAQRLVYLAAREHCLWALKGQEPLANGSAAARWTNLVQAGLTIPLAFDELDIHA